MIGKARKIPVQIEFIQFTDLETGEFIADWLGDRYGLLDVCDKDNPFILISTLEGVMKVNINDYIIKGVKGEFYPVKPEIFHETYEVLKNDES
ncbi:hypothetical protein MUA52_05075 [Staphylococcus agnetis]|uniref:hypothetical protein n=1 Tax=Staphylococcus agnetis TaxID=985762 RepID=UPI0021D19113|nr:hypothetical protein [Staphylococcus agnetis]UXU66015.1 hypothetical protein MUA52_09285 [Staphylococcus agnetis]UXU67458.1 hypothetical protein MUA52_05075 [Staphylococcus agnetis]